MIKTELFTEKLLNSGVDFFTGVPDSLLKNFCQNISSRDNIKHIVAANEGNAVALAIGSYVSSAKIPVVYMQNSGLGNAINPLLSIASPDVYSIPILLIIGWRGEPGTIDEPQHMNQGEVTLQLLDTIGIDYEVLSGNWMIAKNQVDKALINLKKNSIPYALVVRKDIFSIEAIVKEDFCKYCLTREEVLKYLIYKILDEDIIVATTGKTSRELYELRKITKTSHKTDFLNIGGMGHTSQIALGIALNKQENRIICIDGDGSAIMHMGALAISGCSNCKNFYHIIINNGMHESVGGQRTVGYDIDFVSIAKACGYAYTDSIEKKEDLENLKLYEILGPALIEIRVKSGSRGNLGRPTNTTISRKNEFMREVCNEKNIL